LRYAVFESKDKRVSNRDGGEDCDAPQRNDFAIRHFSHILSRTERRLDLVDVGSNMNSDTPEGEHASGVHPAWLDEVVAQCQQVAGRSVAADRDELREMLSGFVRAVATPRTQVERLVFKSLLLDLAYHAGCTAHERVHGGDVGTCRFLPGALLTRFWSHRDESETESFEAWLTTYFAALNQTHPPTLGSSIGRLLRREFRKSWTLAGLAQRFNATPSRVQRAFRTDFGFSVRYYLHLVRLVAALPFIRREKIEAVALQVGYKSKQNFYRDFERLMRMTPTEFRKLREHQVSEIRDKASLQLVRRLVLRKSPRRPLDK
jgi:AraC-like DNA-binding protein